MGDTKQVTLPTEDGNTELATVDGVTLIRGDTEPKDLTDDQIKRLEDAGMKLAVQGRDDSDPIDKIRTHEQADEALKASGVTVADGTSLEDKKKALRAARDEAGGGE